MPQEDLGDALGDLAFNVWHVGNVGMSSCGWRARRHAERSMDSTERLVTIIGPASLIASLGCMASACELLVVPVVARVSHPSPKSIAAVSRAPDILTVAHIVVVARIRIKEVGND